MRDGRTRLLRESVTVGKAHEAVREFCKDLSLAPRGHAFFDGGWNVGASARVKMQRNFRRGSVASLRGRRTGQGGEEKEIPRGHPPLFNTRAVSK